MLTNNLFPPPPAQKTILIVEDEFAVATDLQQILEKAGYYVSGMAFTVAEALAINQRMRPDLVLLDIHLQGPQTGIDLARLLNADHIPFVYVSANTNASTIEEAKTTQPYGFLVKPFREKDVLVALEIAYYRHAHSMEATIRYQKSVQIAVNSALMTIQERDALCKEVANQVNRLIPITIFGLRIGTHSGTLAHSVSLQKNSQEAFEVLKQDFLTEGNYALFNQKQAETQALWNEETGIFNGEDFERLCDKYLLYRTFQSRFGCQSVMRFRLQMKSGVPVSIALASSEPHSFTQACYELIQLISPQLMLAFENLIAFEEIRSREQIKTAELALINAFTSGQPYPETIRDVAGAINQIIPCDLLSVYRAGMELAGSNIDATVIKKDGAYVAFSLLDLFPLPEDLARRQQQLDAVRDLFDHAGMYVGGEYARISNRNETTQLYSETLGLKCCLIVPIIVKGTRLASVVLASKTPFAFTEKDFDLFQQVSLQMALGIENQMTFHRIQSLTEQLRQENTYLLEEVKTGANYEEIIGSSPSLINVFKSIGQVAPTDYTVLILGETGTGKELIARAVHNRSGRPGKTLIKVNCAALPPQLIESELFGHEKGSFTGATDKRIGKFELAHGGTIFLDEIGELPLELQPKLLRVIQEKEIERIGGRAPIKCDVRIIAATNRNLQEEVAAGRFRADLFYRLNIFPVLLPPLRDRKDDLLPLIKHFLQKISKKLGKMLSGISEASLQQMQAYHWPGNIRELEHLLERAAIMTTTPIISLGELLAVESPVPPAPLVAKSHEQAERENVLAALRLTNFRIRGTDGAAALLNVKPTTLEAQIVRLGIRREDYL